MTSIHLSNVFPWKTLSFWIWTLGWINRNRLASLGISPCRGSGLSGRTAFLPYPRILGGLDALVGLLLPFIVAMDSL